MTPSSERWKPVLLAILFLTVLLFVPKLFLAGSPLYTKLITPQFLHYFGSLSRIFLLLAALLYATRSALVFEKGNPVRPAWVFLAAGLFFYFVAQAILGVYQIGFGTAAPFPSLADPLFLLAMILWFIALAMFIRVYHQAGFLDFGRSESIRIVLGFGIPLVILAFIVLWPIARMPVPAMNKALNLAYPVSDLLLLIPVGLLTRVAVRLWGGKVLKVWTLLLAGFVFLAFADILFAYFDVLDLASVDPLVDVLYAASYVFLCWGTICQYDLVQS